jgi:hypothetical protein
VLHITFSFSLFRTFSASSLWFLTAEPCYVLKNPAHIFFLSASLCSSAFAFVFVLLFC